MKNSNDFSNDHPKKDRALLIRGVILGICESLAVGSTFYLGFILTRALALSPQLTYFAPYELLLMSLGAAFSYSFVFVYRSSYKIEDSQSPKKLASDLLRNISYAYLLHLAILFLVKDSGFTAVRTAVGLGYFMGFLSLLANRFLMSPLLGSTQIREGKKKIIIGKPQQTDSVPVNQYHPSGPDLNFGQAEFMINRRVGPGARVNVVPKESETINSNDPSELKPVVH